MLAIVRNQYLCRASMPRQQRAHSIVGEIALGDWHRLSAGDGAKGPRLYDWVMCRRSLEKPGELAYDAVYAPFGTPHSTLVQVAGRRWVIEEGFETCKQQVGLDEYEMRSWTGWYRHITLALLGHAYLVVLRAHAVELVTRPENRLPPITTDWPA